MACFRRFSGPFEDPSSTSTSPPPGQHQIEASRHLFRDAEITAFSYSTGSSSSAHPQLPLCPVLQSAPFPSLHSTRRALRAPPPPLPPYGVVPLHRPRQAMRPVATTLSGPLLRCDAFSPAARQIMRRGGVRICPQERQSRRRPGPQQKKRENSCVQI